MKPLLHQFEQCCWDLRGVLSVLNPDDVCCEGLTPRQCRVLRTVRDEPDRGIGELARREGLTPSGMSRRIDPLVAGGFLVRRRGAPEDGRTVRLELTRKGEEALAAVERLTYGAFDRVWRALPAAERATVVGGLRVLIEAARRGGRPESGGEAALAGRAIAPRTRRKKK